MALPRVVYLHTSLNVNKAAFSQVRSRLRLVIPNNLKPLHFDFPVYDICINNIFISVVESRVILVSIVIRW